MKMPCFLFILLILSSLQACKSKENSFISTFQDDVFIFGYFNDFCGGNCTQIFLIQNGKLYPDAMDRFKSPPVFSAIPLSDELYSKALPAIEQFPQSLLTEVNTGFGCPGCVDQGILYVAKEIDGKLVYWHLDPQTTALPSALQAYGQLLSDILSQMPE